MNPSTSEQIELKQRGAARKKSYGCITGSDEFLAEKHAETARELAKETASRNTILESLE